MKRLCLVLFVCLGVQLNAASAPFLHLHARVTPGAEHHDAPVVHRHAPSDASGAHRHDAPADETSGGPASVAASDITAAMVIGGLAGTLPSPVASLAPPVRAPRPIAAPRPSIPPDVDVGDSLPDDPDPRSSSHRGPPR